MPAEADPKGWILHSHGQGRRFGPLSEDELRNYFRAGMVKSVDRLTAPGETAMLPASEVATTLGEAVPVGPPPPEVREEPAPPAPAVVAGPPRDQAGAEERAARAAAAMNIDIAALMASNAPAKRSSGWLLPAIMVVVLVVMLFAGLNMLSKLGPAAAGNRLGDAEPVPDIRGPSEPDAASDPLTRAVRVPEPAAEEAITRNPVSHSGDDAGFRQRFEQAQGMKRAGEWGPLAAMARSWAATDAERNEPLYFLGLSQARLGQNPEAIETLRKLRARDPGNAEARKLLADTHLQANDFAAAAGIYKEIVAATPNDARVWNNYGVALHGSGENEQARAALETAVRLDPDFKQAWGNLGNLYQSVGENAKASAAFANSR